MKSASKTFATVVLLAGLFAANAALAASTPAVPSVSVSVPAPPQPQIQISSVLPGQQAPFVQVCASELQAFCKNVQPGGGRRLNCLNANRSKLSPACQVSLAEELKRRSTKTSSTSTAPSPGH